MPKTYPELRSARWFEGTDRFGFVSRERIKQSGVTDEDFRGKPVIGVLSTWSELNPCHIHFRDRAEKVKRGVWEAGGFPVEIPVMSLGEAFMRPTTMIYRDLLSIEVEETLRCHPLDGVVLMGGCDKTTPAMIMGASSMNLPAIFMPAGPMLTGRWRGQTLGSGTDSTRYYQEMRAGRISEAAYHDMEYSAARSPGHCMTMGTASTMTSMAEVLGMTLPGAASIPAVDSRHSHMASRSGRAIVEMVWQDRKPRDLLTRASFENAILTLMALGGSTNAVIHLVAMADRVGISLTLDDFADASERLPVLADIKPNGAFLMEDFFYAGGLRGLLSRIRGEMHLAALTVNGRTLGENIDGAEIFDENVIRPLDRPLFPTGGLVVLRGNLAPDGCILKRSAATPALLHHVGKAVVFKDYEDMKARIDDPDLDVDADSVLVLQGSGVRGVPGMPEWGMLPIPKKLLRQGVNDMVRVSDARMSGTHFGTVALHVSPESAAGGPLAFVRDGDLIELDVDKRRLQLLVDDAELEERRRRWVAPAPRHERGWGKLYAEHVQQPDRGAGLDFLTGAARRNEPRF
jgi:dihydroxy-acid dehydratase